MKAFSKKYLFFLSFLLFLAPKGQSTHIVGGELSYVCLGNNVYRITLKVYRDCFNGIPPFDNPTTITIYDSAGVVLGTQDVVFPGSTIIPIVLDNPCLNPPDNVCVEEAVFVTNITLPPRPGGYILAYQRCCRNNTINNIVSPGATGATYSNAILDTAIVKCNSSPRFNNFPPIFICQNNPLVFDHSATDPDGDSLVYELSTPFTGGDQFNPYPVPATVPPPPFAPITWAFPYSQNDPLGGVPLQIDPHTGILTGVPNTLGQFVVGVIVKEYRDSVLINIHRRDFQFNVTYCPPKVTASIPEVIRHCGYTLQFVNNSVGAITYHWDFGVIGIDSDTSNLFSPTYTFPAIGNYTVTLITNPGFFCADTATSDVTIYEDLEGANFTFNNGCAQTPIQFTDLSVLTEGTPSAWVWNFGDGTALSSLQNPLHAYNAAGNYKVFFTVFNEINCVDTISKWITIYPRPPIDAGPDQVLCPWQTTSISASGALSYLWESSTYLSCTACQSTLVTLPNGVNEYFTVTGTNIFGCTASDSVRVTVRPVLAPVVSFTPKGRCVDKPFDFDGEVTNYDFFCYPNVAWQWNFGDGNTSTAEDPSHLYAAPGTYTVTLQVPNSNMAVGTVLVLPADSCLRNLFVPNTFTPNGDGNNDFLFLRTINSKKVSLRLYNRWGEEVFRTDNLQQGWDGMYKGVKQSPQVFEYIAEVTFYDDSVKTLEGNVTLVE